MTTQNETHVPQWTLGDRLRKAREEAGYTQRELAAAIGISRNSVVNYEVGATEPKRLAIQAWARLTGVPSEWLTWGVVAPGQKPPGLRYGRSRRDRQMIKVAA